jgi:hypothetical protein
MMNMLHQETRDILSQYFKPDDVVVVAPLNWGLGHSTRCIPLIHFAREHCKKVIIASDGPALEVLKMEFPDIEHYELPDYGIKYVFESIVVNISLAIPGILRAMWREHTLAKKIAENTAATVILSDNRLGFRVDGLRNYYLTHQISIAHKSMFVAALGSALHQHFIRRFDVCLVPDFEGPKSLCPALSQNNNLKKHFIGPLTRIERLELTKKWDICALLSGPEPQRSILEQLLLTELNGLDTYSILFVRGVMHPMESLSVKSHIRVENLLTTTQIENALNASRCLISRSGYSTIMDINHLEIKAIFIPTPGQTEQEYLANHSVKNPRYRTINQNEIKKLSKIIKYLI